MSEGRPDLVRAPLFLFGRTILWMACLFALAEG